MIAPAVLALSACETSTPAATLPHTSNDRTACMSFDNIANAANVGVKSAPGEWQSLYEFGMAADNPQIRIESKTLQGDFAGAKKKLAAEMAAMAMTCRSFGFGPQQ